MVHRDTQRPSLIKNHPGVVTVSIIAAVLVHALTTLTGWIPNIWERLILGEPSIALDIYLGAGAAAAIVAGFAGVVVVYGLTATGSRFRQLRIQAGDSLGRNWTSASVVGFAATGLCLAAAILHSLGLAWLAPWLLELSLLLLLHGTWRIIWLLRELMVVAEREDAAAERQLAQKVFTPSDFR